MLDWTDEKDVSDAKDGGVMKKILREGEGWEHPKDDWKVQVTYTAYLVNTDGMFTFQQKYLFPRLSSLVPHQSTLLLL